MSIHILRPIFSASFGIAVLAASTLSAQRPSPEQSAAAVVFTSGAVPGVAKAIDYKSQSGKTKLLFEGTELAKPVSGEATVESKGVEVQIEVKFERLSGTQKFGAEYLTYVLWAIAPDGRAANLGELRRDKLGDAKLTTTCELQTFGMILTAEPYYAVRIPSGVIIAENTQAKGSKDAPLIDAKYERLKPGAYQKLADPLGLSLDLESNPLDIYQARNALAIAVSVGANDYALDAIRRAEASLEMTNSPVMAKGRRKERIALARQAAQFAEEARAQAVQHIAKVQNLEPQAATKPAK